jgi:hypothetical protein
LEAAAYVICWLGLGMAAALLDSQGMGPIIGMIGGIAALGLAITPFGVFMSLEGTKGTTNMA